MGKLSGSAGGGDDEFELQLRPTNQELNNLNDLKLQEQNCCNGNLKQEKDDQNNKNLKPNHEIKSSNDENNRQTNNSDNLHLSILSSDDQLDAYLVQNEILANSINLFRSEFRRLGFNEKHWRYTSFNKNFTLCSTYPPYFIVPAQFVDEDLVEVAKFRHMGRLPVPVYRHQNGAVIARSSQPSVGLLGRRSIEDERLLQLIYANCIQDQSELLEKSKTPLSSILNDIEQNNSLTKNFSLTNYDCSDDDKKQKPSEDNHAANGDHIDCEQMEIKKSKEDKDSANSSKNHNDNQVEEEPDQTKYSDCTSNHPKTVIPPAPPYLIKKNCQPSTQSSKFFSLPDKLLENIMSYTSYTPDSNSQTISLSNSPVASNRKLLILDARSFTVAFLNRAFGGGSECSEYYPNCEVDFLYLANIHAVRTAFFSLKALVRTENNQYYFSNWSKSGSNYWLYYISNLIESALKVVQAIDRDARPVLVHCSDGWDRTAQILSLAELMLDPFYRTIEGFRVLVQREWLDFGHKFADRCGVNPVTKNINERSPIFIQWLDCVHQIVRQCPIYFEFNCTYLEELALHTYSPLFGTFSCNNYLERFINQIHGETNSVWSYLEKSKDKFINENYIYTIKVLTPCHSINEMCVWRELYTKLITQEFESRFDLRNTAQISTNKSQSENNSRKKKLFRTNSFLCQQQRTKNNTSSFVGSNLRKFKSDSELLTNLKGRLRSTNDEQLSVTQPNNSVNFPHADWSLSSQPAEHRTVNHTNGGQLNGKNMCKFQSKNCDSEKFYQHQLPLSVISKIAQIANSNPDSSLMYSILTYVNTLHTFSVK